MKMKGLRVSLALLLVLVILATVAPTAFAADVERGYTITLGDNVWIAIEAPNAQTVSNYSLNSGALPQGLTYGVNGNSLVIHGTAAAVENTAADFSVTAGPATYAYNVSFYVTETPVATPAPTPDPAAANTNTAANTNASTAAASTANNTNSKLPRVTKSPTDETVEEGKQAEFVARYENAIWAVWKFISPDGNTVLRYDEAKDYFEGLVIIDGNYSHMILKKIPYSLNGWRVACEYRNNEGSVMTDMATITVIPKVTPTPEPTPTPTPTPTPEPTVTPAATMAPIDTAGTGTTGTTATAGTTTTTGTTATTGTGTDTGSGAVIQATEDGADASATAGTTTGTSITTGRTTASGSSRTSSKKFPLIPLLVILLAAVAIGLIVFFLRRRREDEEDDYDYEEPVVRTRSTRSSRGSSGYQGRHTANRDSYVEDDEYEDDDYDDEN